MASAVMPLYLRGSVSFGTALAALTATMGDASFVLIAADPQAALLVHALLLVTGITTGYVADALRIDPRRRLLATADLATTPPTEPAAQWPTHLTGLVAAPAASDGEAVPPRPRVPVGVPTASLFALSLPALVVATPSTLGLSTPLLGGIDPYLAIGVVGAVVCAAVLLRDAPSLADDGPQPPSSVAATLRHAGHEAAFVTAWSASPSPAGHCCPPCWPWISVRCRSWGSSGCWSAPQWASSRGVASVITTVPAVLAGTAVLVLL